MNALTPTHELCLDACRDAPFPAESRTSDARTAHAMHVARALLARVMHTLQARRRRRHERLAFHGTFEALHRLDARMLTDIGLRPDQLTAFAHATSRASPDAVQQANR